MRVRLVAVGAMMAAVCSCGDSDVNDLGTELTRAPYPGSGELDYFGPLFWSASGSEVAYVGGGIAVFAVDVERRTTRRIMTIDPVNRHIVRAGEWLYIDTFVSQARRRLVRVAFAGGPVELVAEPDNVSPSFAVSDDGATVAYVRDGALRLVAPGETPSLGSDRPLLFSPDGERLLVARVVGPGITAGLSSLRFRDGQSTPLPRTPGAMLAVRWSGSGLRALRREAGGVSVVDLTTGETTFALSEAFLSVAFTPRGDGVFYATSRCAETGFRLIGGNACVNTEYSLRMAVPGASEQVVARGYTAGAVSAGVVGVVQFSAPVPSPSGDSIAFTFGSRLYVKRL